MMHHKDEASVDAIAFVRACKGLGRASKRWRWVMPWHMKGIFEEALTKVDAWANSQLTRFLLSFYAVKYQIDTIVVNEFATRPLTR